MRYSNQRASGALPDAESPEPNRGTGGYSASKSDGKKKGRKPSHKKSQSCAQPAAPAPSNLIINTYNTTYDVVSLAASAAGFKERKVDPALCSNPYLFLEGANSGNASFNF